MVFNLSLVAIMEVLSGMECQLGVTGKKHYNF